MSIPNETVSPSTAKKAFQCCCSITETNFEVDGTPDIEIFNCILNIPSSVAATFGNALVLISIWRTTCLHSPSNVLLAGLALSDLSVGMVVQPILVVNTIAKINRVANVFCTSSILILVIGSILCGVSLLTLTAISLDRFTALHLHLRYREIITIKRVFAVLTSMWLGCILYGVSYLWSPKLLHYVSIVIILTSLIVVTTTYCRIYQVVRRHQIQIQATQVIQQDGGRPPNISTHKKLLVNMLIIYLVFLICYLPFLVVRATIMISGTTVTSHSALELSFSVMSINSTLNPFIYCWRFADIREAVRETTRQLFRHPLPRYNHSSCETEF